MFADIKKTNHLSKTLRYHELKIELGKAECLAAENFVKDLDQLTRKDKLFHFNRLISLNERMVKHVFHIALLFYPEEILSNEKMLKMSREYMEKMDLAKQPYLIYRHYDSNYPHVHLLTVAVKQNGRRIELTPTDLSQSSEITHKMEIKYELLKTGHKLRESVKLMMAAHKKEYLHQTIQLPKKVQIPEEVSLPEQPTIKKEIVMPKQRETLYPEPDIQTKPEIPRQSPSIRHFQPDPNTQRVITAIEWVLVGKTHDFNSLREDLAMERVSMDIRKEGIFYKDQISKTTFEGHELGHRYTLEGLREQGVTEKLQQLDQSLEQKQTHRIRHSF